MASRDSVEAVKAGIGAVYANRSEPKRATRGEIIAAAQVSQKTFYRVLENHPEVRELLDYVESAFLSRPTQIELAESDPVKRNPHGAVDELLAVVASLVSIIEEQKVRIRDLEVALDIATDPSKSNYPEPRQLSAARARHRKCSRGPTFNEHP